MVERGFHLLADDLRRRILAGDLALGDRLPSEPELALQYGVSRSTVREALRVLESQSLVVTTRGAHGGSSINHPNREQIASYLETGFRLMTLAGDESVISGEGPLSVESLLEVRSIIEVPTAELAAENRTEAHLEELFKSISAHEDGGRMRSIHRSFHAIVCEASGNRLLATVSEPIFTVIEKRYQNPNDSIEFLRSVRRDHEKIFNAIKDKDRIAAGVAMRAHLSNLSKVYLERERMSILALASKHISPS